MARTAGTLDELLRSAEWKSARSLLGELGTALREGFSGASKMGTPVFKAELGKVEKQLGPGMDTSSLGEISEGKCYIQHSFDQMLVEVESDTPATKVVTELRQNIVRKAAEEQRTAARMMESELLRENKNMFSDMMKKIDEEETRALNDPHGNIKSLDEFMSGTDTGRYRLGQTAGADSSSVGTTPEMRCAGAYSRFLTEQERHGFKLQSNFCAGRRRRIPTHSVTTDVRDASEWEALYGCTDPAGDIVSSSKRDAEINRAMSGKGLSQSGLGADVERGNNKEDAAQRAEGNPEEVSVPGITTSVEGALGPAIGESAQQYLDRSLESQHRISLWLERTSVRAEAIGRRSANVFVRAFRSVFGTVEEGTKLLEESDPQVKSMKRNWRGWAWKVLKVMGYALSFILFFNTLSHINGGCFVQDKNKDATVSSEVKLCGDATYPHVWSMRANQGIRNNCNCNDYTIHEKGSNWAQPQKLLDAGCLDVGNPKGRPCRDKNQGGFEYHFKDSNFMTAFFNFAEAAAKNGVKFLECVFKVAAELVAHALPFIIFLGLLTLLYWLGPSVFRIFSGGKGGGDSYSNAPPRIVIQGNNG